MPNWITNKISAPKHVILAMLNEAGRVDFSTIAKFPGPVEFDGIYFDAETAAEMLCNKPMSSNSMVSNLQRYSRSEVDIKEMADESFGQFIGMLQNFRACGYLHSMEYARDVWGTKWNACESSADPEAGTAEFDTAWSCPEGVLVKLSRRFPGDEIKITYADKNIGSNCGTFTLKAGESILSNIAPAWWSMSTDDKRKWISFACEVTGRDATEYLEGYE